MFANHYPPSPTNEDDEVFAPPSSTDSDESSSSDSDCETSAVKRVKVVPVKQEREKKYRCRRDPNCPAAYTSSYHQNKHERKAHPLPGEEKQCLTCNKKLFGDKKFQQHVDKCVRSTTSTGVPALPPTLPPVLSSSSSWPPPLSSAQLVVPPLDVDAVKAAITPFLQWLGIPGSTPQSIQVKQSLLVTEKQIKPVRSALTTLINTVHRLFPTIFSNGVYLGALVQLATVEALHVWQNTRRLRGSHTGKQGVGEDSKYKLNLLIAKVIVYLAAMQTQQSPDTVWPESFAAYGLVTQAAHHSGRKRKMEHRNRAVLGDKGLHLLYC